MPYEDKGYQRFLTEAGASVFLLQSNAETSAVNNKGISEPERKLTEEKYGKILAEYMARKYLDAQHYAALGDMAFALGKHEEAISHYTNVLKKRPDWSVFVDKRKEAYRKLYGVFGEYEYLEEAHQSQPDNPRILYDLVCLASELSYFGKVIECVDLYLQINKFDHIAEKATMLNARGNAFLKLDRLDEAERDLIESNQIFPNACACARLAELRRKQERFQEAWEFLKQSFELEPQNKNGLYARGLLLMDAEKYEEAIQDLNESTQNPYASYYLGLCKYKLGQYNEAVYDFTRFLEGDIASVDQNFRAATLRILVETHYALENYSNLLNSLNSLIDLEPNNSDLLLLRSEIFFRTGQVQKAREDLNLFSSLKNDSKAFLLKFINEKIQRKSFNIVLKYLEFARKEYPDDIDFLICESKVLSKEGDFESCISVANSAIDLLTKQGELNQEKWQQLLIDKGRSLCLLGDYHHAVETLNSALNFVPNNIKARRTIYAYLGSALTQMNRADEGLICFENAYSCLVELNKVNNNKSKKILKLFSFEFIYAYLSLLKIEEAKIFFEKLNEEERGGLSNEVMQLAQEGKGLNYEISIESLLEKYQLDSVFIWVGILFKKHPCDKYFNFLIQSIPAIFLEGDKAYLVKSENFLRLISYAFLKGDQESAQYCCDILLAYFPLDAKASRWQAILNNFQTLSDLEKLRWEVLACEHLNDVERAEKILLTYSENKPDGFHALEILTDFYVRLYRYEQALENVSKLVMAMPNDARFLVKQADIYYFMTNWVEAKKSLEKALILDPHNNVILGRLGIISRMLGDNSQAITYFNQSLNYVKEPLILWHRGMACAALGMEEAAKQDLAQAEQAGFKPEVMQTAREVITEQSWTQMAFFPKTFEADDRIICLNQLLKNFKKNQTKTNCFHIMNLISSLTDISFSFFDRQELMQVASYAYIKGFDEQKILMNALLKFFQEDQEVICWKKMLETINQSEEAFLNAVETVETEANSESALVNLSYLLSCVHQYRFPDTDISAAFSKAAHAKNSNAQFVLRSSPHDRVKPSYDKLMYCANFLLFTDNRKMPKNRVVAGEVADCYLQNAFQ